MNERTPAGAAPRELDQTGEDPVSSLQTPVQNKSKSEVEKRVTAHPIGANAYTRGMVERLMRENGWSRRFSLGAIEEYRRFCVLAVMRGGRVSPSDVVDTVWHTHLLYTKDYWDEFCPRVLGFRLHHVPDSGAKGEGDALDLQYEQTLVAYRKMFGECPPEAMWPEKPVHVHRSKVDRREFWIVPKIPVVLLVAACVVVTACAVVLSG